MRAKPIIATLLLLFVGVSVAAILLKAIVRSPEPVAVEETEAAPAHQVIAYYFHGSTRCMTCRTIEAYSEEAIRTAFAGEMEDSRLLWLPLNVEEPEHEHFVGDYQLRTRSVVLAELKDGETVRWKNLEEVWTRVANKDEFFAYIQSETRDFLDAALSEGEQG